MTPTQCHWSIRGWRNVSLSIVAARPDGLPLRPGAGWPERITPSIRRTAGTRRATAATVSANETTIAKICMGDCSSVGAYEPEHRAARGADGRLVGVRWILPAGNFRGRVAWASPRPGRVRQLTIATFSISVSLA